MEKGTEEGEDETAAIVGGLGSMNANGNRI
jgi:hypothetical protein